MSKFFMVIVAAVILFVMYGVGLYNKMISGDEGVTASWSEVVNQYQRRADLVPNLVSTVKGFAEQEKDVLLSVVEARNKATSVQITPETVNSAEALNKFSQAQAQLGGALGRLLVTVERYPDIKSGKNFLELQTQLEGSENRISVARKRYIDSVRNYNLSVRKFPASYIANIMGFRSKANFTVENEEEISAPPTVDFNGSSSTTAPTTN